MSRYINLFLCMIFALFFLSVVNVFADELDGTLAIVENAPSSTDADVNDPHTYFEEPLDEAFGVDSEESEEWFLGLPIYKFEYSGLSNFTKDDIDRVLNEYLDDEFSYELLSEMQDALYALPDSFASIDPSADRDENGRLVVIFDFKELRRINTITFVGNAKLNDRTLRRALQIKEKGAFFSMDVRKGESDLLNCYHDNGFRSATISSSYTEDDEKNIVDIVYTVDEGLQSRVNEFAFEGAYSFNSSELISAMRSNDKAMRVGGYYDDSKLESNIDALLNFYHEKGFVDVTVRAQDLVDVSENTETDGHRYIVTFTINEGWQWRLGEITFVGVEKFDTAVLRSKISLKNNDILNYDKINADFENVMGEYYDNGYIFSTYSSRETRSEEKGTIDIIYTINEGIQAHITEVTISGNLKTKDYVFLREVTLKPGEVFSRANLIKSLQNVYNTTLVSDVNYSLKPSDEEGGVSVEIIVTESKQMDLTLGLTFGGNNTGFPISFLASVSDKNLAGKGMKLSAGVQVTTDYQAVNLSWSDSWVGDKRWANGVFFQFERSYKTNVLRKNPNSDYLFGRNRAYPYGYNSYAEWEARNETLPASKYLMNYEMYRFSIGYNTGYTWSFNPGRLTLSGSLSFGLNKVYYNENEGIPYEYLIYQYNQRWQFSNSLSLSISWDGRDFVENTTRGYLISESITYAGGILGGLSNYIKSNTSVSGYISLFSVGKGLRPRSLVLSLTSNLGLMLPQWWHCDVDAGRETGWQWHDPKYGATKSEMLYIDGMMISRGTDSVYDLSFLWDNILELSFPIVTDVINIEAFTSLTATAPELSLSKKLAITWYGAVGLGFRLKVSGFPLGLYFVGNYSFSDTQGVTWKTGGIFNYIRPVLSISTSLF